jgi:hypothetical protein
VGQGFRERAVSSHLVTVYDRNTIQMICQLCYKSCYFLMCWKSHRQSSENAPSQFVTHLADNDDRRVCSDGGFCELRLGLLSKVINRY